MKNANLIEQHFKKKIKDVIETHHWQGGMSLNKLCQVAGVCRQGLMYDLRKLKIPVMNRKEIEKHLDRGGANSYWFGKKSPSSSKRMKQNNPVFDKEVLKKSAKSHAKRMKLNPTPAELQFMNNLIALKVPFIFQKPVDQYILDFEINGLAFEVMRVKSIPKNKKLKFEIRSKYLESIGIKTVMVDKRKTHDLDYVKELLRLQNVLDANDVVING